MTGVGSGPMGSGSDIVGESETVTLLYPDLSRIPKILSMSRFESAVIRQNFFGPSSLTELAFPSRYWGI